MKQAIYSVPVCVVLSLAGCGGDGGGGNSTTTYTGSIEQAVITEDSSEQLARSATQGATEATKGGDLAALPLAVQVSTHYDLAENIILSQLPQEVADLANASSPSAYQEERACGVSGSVQVSASDSIDFSSDTMPESGSMTMDFRDCSDEASTTVDGLVKITFIGNNRFTSVYQNFTVTYNDPVSGEQIVETIENLTMTCSGVGDSYGDYECSVQSDFIGTDNRTYRVSDMSVTGNDTSGWNVSATVYDSDLGSVLIDTTSPLMLDCSSSVPSSGSLTVTGANNATEEVTYNGCTEFQVCLDSVCNTYSW